MMLKNLIPFLFLLAIISSCGGEKKKGLSEYRSLKEGEEYLITIETSMGNMQAILYDETPLHKENFVKLAVDGFYDDLLFHRVMSEFMIQGGDPTSRDAGSLAKLGMGSPGYTIPAEFNPSLIHKKGALSAARIGGDANPDKESNGSQFFVVEGKVFSEEELKNLMVDYQQMQGLFVQLLEKEEYYSVRQEAVQLQVDGEMEKYGKLIMDNKEVIEEEFGVELDKPISEQQLQAYTSIGGYPSLDGEYTVFGEVITGLDVLEKISQVPTGSGDRPFDDVSFKVVVEIMPKPTIEQKFGISLQ
ncbi:peptidylprolyl isomerase [Flammeovirgaceae bacterium SG7u.111]|nr:peptidylprolyl isomerase [Flammeovirgaceae bacterium SG7u.132]WPO35378.1 peptidylprolyl isomerase [Flammeovirgaceae bacterium SG7u.111]